MNVRLLRSIATCTLTAGLLVACGGSDDASTPGESVGVENESADEASAAPDAQNTGNADPYEVTRTELESFEEVTTSEGAQLMVGADCDPMTGANLLRVAAKGLTGGPYSATIEPAVGGRPDLNVQPDGTAYSARQTTLDARSYTVTYPDLDGGTTFTFAGCPS